MEEYIQQQMQLLKEWWESSLEEVDYKNLEKFIREIYLAGKNSVPLDGQVRQGVPQPVFACGNCKHYKKDFEYNGLGNCENPEVMGSRLILGHCDEQYLTEDFGCRFYEES